MKMKVKTQRVFNEVRDRSPGLGKLLALVPAAIVGGVAYRSWRVSRRRQARERRLDEAVDQACLDSFPASDPPSYAGGCTLDT